MSDRIARVSVRILEKEYQVACPVEERTDLLDAAEYLNSKMREIRDNGSVVGLDRVAVMAALNIANELLKDRRKESGGDTGLLDRVRHLRERVESAITRGKQMEI
ncbi:MAG TPA: cell division protein ZapA [Steroidobacteraceae bacterium]|nr:cell division protein ZapA [Steroidobacteraceae bacterium]